MAVIIPVQNLVSSAYSASSECGAFRFAMSDVEYTRADDPQ